VSRKKVLAPGLVPIEDRWLEQPDATFLKGLQDEIRTVATLDARRPAGASEWAEAMKGVNIIAGGVRVDEDFLKHADELEMIQSIGVGYDHMDVRACARKGIIVCNVAEIYTEPVAQHAWALILDLTKHVTRADRSMREGDWKEDAWKASQWTGVQLWGKTLGVIGLGNIGSRIAMKGRLAFDMKVLAYDPYILPSRFQLFGARSVNLEELLRESDVVSVCVPLTPETRRIIGSDELSMMKKSAFLINICRGPVIDQKALIEFLQKGGIRGAGLDVFEVEPLPQDNPLLKMENVVLTPHIASSTKTAVEETYKGAVDNIIRYVEGFEPYWTIDPDLYGG